MKKDGAKTRPDREEFSSLAPGPSKAGRPGEAPSGNLNLLRPSDRQLTRREKEILRCLAKGMSTVAIAERLFIARVTVRNHVQHILQKLGVHSKLAAVLLARRLRLI